MRIATAATNTTTTTTRARKGEGEEDRKKCLAGGRKGLGGNVVYFKVDDDRYFPSCFFVEIYVNQSSINLFYCYNNTIVFLTQIDRSEYV